MKEIIVYREKGSNKIVNFYKTNDNCTDENIAKYNSNEDCPTKAEKVVLQDNSLELYFYEMKTFSRNELFRELKDINDAISKLSSDIDNKLCQLEEKCNDGDE